MGGGSFQMSVAATTDIHSDCVTLTWPLFHVDPQLLADVYGPGFVQQSWFLMSHHLLFLFAFPASMISQVMLETVLAYIQFSIL